MQLKPSELRPIATIDPRFQSYNVEMVEVTGGRFWSPYAVFAAGGGLYHQRAPIDLENPKLRRLATALGPAYMRVSGTWANSTWFCDSDPLPSQSPEGFVGVLSHQQWQGVIDFARVVDAEITTSAAISAGTRDAAGRWQPDQVRRLFAATRNAGGSIAGIEFMNEPSAGAGAPQGYDAAAFARDHAAFRDAVRAVSPKTLILGPSALGDKRDDPNEPALAAGRILELSAADHDVLSYHHYGAASRRCSSDGWWPQTRAQDALGEDWLGRTEQALQVYRQLRDRFLPGKPIWLTETADAVCGGNPWASTFLDSFRYLDQLGRLARGGVQVVMHNTLAASDYGLIDEATLTPRPNYWCALLWRRLMGETVFDCGAPTAGYHLYVHSLRDRPNGKAVLALNTDREKEQLLRLPVPSARYTLTARELQARAVMLNGTLLQASLEGVLPDLVAERAAPGSLRLAPASITFLEIPAE
ncbi:hypothetical protein [Dongia sp.]|uniref:hypothetical protein n=1 Tax=Dongia sp. TaxID=1977262 RepID=UPI0037535935